MGVVRMTEGDEMKQHPIYTNYLVDLEGAIHGPRKTLSPILHHTGYRCITVRKDGIQKQYRAHRFILEALNGELIPEDLQVNHKDGNKENNHPSNLELCTGSENCKHRHEMGLSPENHGEDNHMAKLTNSKAWELLIDIHRGMSNGDCGIKYNLNSGYVSLVRHRHRWKKLWEKFDSEFIRSSDNI